MDLKKGAEVVFLSTLVCIIVSIAFPQIRLLRLVGICASIGAFIFAFVGFGWFVYTEGDKKEAKFLKTFTAGFLLALITTLVVVIVIFLLFLDLSYRPPKNYAQQQIGADCLQGPICLILNAVEGQLCTIKYFLYGFLPTLFFSYLLIGLVAFLAGFALPDVKSKLHFGAYSFMAAGVFGIILAFAFVPWLIGAALPPAIMQVWSACV